MNSFTNQGKDLKDFLESLTIEDIRDNFHSATFYKGKNYYESEWVSEVAFINNKTCLTACIQGTQKYFVKIQAPNGVITGECTCPMAANCKHVVAALLFAINDRGYIEIIDNSLDINQITSHLNSLPKDKLIELVLKFAPEQFFVEIKNNYSGGTEAQKAFIKVEKNIKKFFRNEENLYSPYELEKFLATEFPKLSGFEKLLKGKLDNLILFIIQEVENAFDEGYLYDHYSDTHFEEPEAFTTSVENYIKHLPFQEKIDFLEKLDDVFAGSNYLIFDSLRKVSENLFAESDLPDLKRMLINKHPELPFSMMEKYFGLTRHLMSKKEKEIILLRLKDYDSASLIELVFLYKEDQRLMESIKLIEEYFSRKSGFNREEEIYFLYLDLLSEKNLDLKKACRMAISDCPSDTMLEKIATIEQRDVKTYENILEQKNSNGLLNFLQKNGRIAEALDLIKRDKNIWEDRVFLFFKKYKKEVPAEAINYFYNTVEEQLEYASQHSYETIAEALEQIKQLKPDLAAELIINIRKNYKRRRNLMQLIS